MPPKTKGIRNLGIGLIVLGLCFCWMSLTYSSSLSGFAKGLRTYFWKSGNGTVVSTDLRMLSRANGKVVSGSGYVSYSLEIEGESIRAKDEVFKRWDGDTAGKYEAWSSGYAVGNSVNVFYNSSGETSLGHWPTSYTYKFGLQAVRTVASGLSFIIAGTILILLKANKPSHSSPDRPESK